MYAHGRRVLLLALLGAATLCAAAATAPARNLSASTRSFRVVWTPLTVGLTSNSEELQMHVRCNVTMEGSLHSSTIAKVAGSLIGHVVRATIDSRSCSETLGLGGSFSFLSLPWHVTYRNFSGILPLITGVGISLPDMAMQVSNGLITCLARANLERPGKWILELDTSNTIIGFTAEAGGTLPPPSGFGCENWHLIYSGKGRVTSPEGAGSVRVLLI